MKVFPLLLAVASVRALSARQQASFHSQETEISVDWDRAPSSDATGHLIFNSVSTVLQRWPNTIKRPGMSSLNHSVSTLISLQGTVSSRQRCLLALFSTMDVAALQYLHSLSGYVCL